MSIQSVLLEEATADRLEGLLRDLLTARGGRSFGVCASCLFHRVTDQGRRCALLDVELTEADATRICKEHTSQAA